MFDYGSFEPEIFRVSGSLYFILRPDLDIFILRLSNAAKLGVKSYYLIESPLV